MRFPVALIACVSTAACGFQINAAGDGSGSDRIDAAIDSAFDAPACVASWYDLAWTTRKKLTIDPAKVTGSPADVPVLIDLVIPAAQASGHDLVFTAGDGLTRLPYEVERYDAPSGRLVAWVLVPALSSQTGTPIYLYSGNAAAANLQDPTGVWARDYASVWHMNELPSGTAPQIKDSAAAARHATVRGGLQGGQAQGQITGSLVFDGSNDGLDVTSLPLAGTFSYEVWIYPTTNSSWRGIVNNSPAYNRWFGTYNQEADFYDGNTEYRRPASLANAAWHHVAATYDGLELRLYRDGVQMGAAQALTFPAVTSGFQIGYTVGLSEWYAGRIDEVRVSNVARSAGYIATSFNNQDDPGAFVMPGPPETCP